MNNDESDIDQIPESEEDSHRNHPGPALDCDGSNMLANEPRRVLASEPTFATALAAALDIKDPNERFHEIADDIGKILSEHVSNQFRLATRCRDLSLLTGLSTRKLANKLAEFSTKISYSWVARLLKGEDFLRLRPAFRDVQDFERIVMISRIPDATAPRVLADDGHLVESEINVKTCPRRVLADHIRALRSMGNCQKDWLPRFIKALMDAQDKLDADDRYDDVKSDLQQHITGLLDGFGEFEAVTHASRPQKSIELN
ncbi:hypothetical protein WDW86_15810 [Bdellovibrionota bacterium FG-2]